MKTRIVLYVFFDRDGIVDDYVKYQLNELRKEVGKIVVICQGFVNDEGKNTLESLSEQVIYRENKGYDAGAWKDALVNVVGWDEIEKFDDLILMNDSCYGPIYPFSEMFDSMDSKGVDFWGITDHGKIEDPYGLSRCGYFPKHIQSYFICYSRRVHESKSFRDFWVNLRNTLSFEESVTFFEVALTEYLEKAGFSQSVYIDCSKYMGKEYKNYNPTEFGFDEALIQQRNPLIKKKALQGQIEQMIKRSDGSLAKRSLEYIDKNTEYDVNMILDNIIRLSVPRTLFELYHWNYILPESVTLEKIKKRRVALIMHLYYEELFDYCHNYLLSVPDYADVYITIADEEKKKKVEKIFSDIKCNNIEIRLVDNKGMDISALLVACRDVFFKDYDYVGFVHDKMSLKETNPRSGEGFLNNLFTCTLESKEYVENIFSTFDKNPRLGLLVPPYPMSGSYIRFFGVSWFNNFEGTRKLAEKLGLNCVLDKDIDTIAVGTVFWCRPMALKKLFIYEWTYDDFEDNEKRREGDLLHNVERIFEFAAQDQQYYTGVVMPIKHAELIYSVTNRVLRESKWLNRYYKRKIKSKTYRYANKIANILKPSRKKR